MRGFLGRHVRMECGKTSVKYMDGLWTFDQVTGKQEA